MKNIIITLCLAVTIICAAIFLERNSDTSSEPTIAKTLVKCDEQGRILEETTYAYNNNSWVEESKIVRTYEGENVELVDYKKVSGEWVRVAKRVKLYENESLMAEVTYKPTQNEWTLTESVSYEDISSFETFDDMLFDKDGYLIMSAKYEETSEGINGLTKEEYEYDGGVTPCKRTTYAWSGSEWQKSQEQTLQYVD
ncbi:MAG: hypothetical protein HUJ96_00695 [Marinilabiliaceae bacterium]|nr:hypothetical protein [Marinilabiliaceae bacterium]